jgi:hypothetical protein
MSKIRRLRTGRPAFVEGPVTYFRHRPALAALAFAFGLLFFFDVATARFFSGLLFVAL